MQEQNDAANQYEGRYQSCPEIPHFGAWYPDARCIDGQLYDLDKCDSDGGLFEPGDYIPCPFCQTAEYIEYRLDDGTPEEQAKDTQQILTQIDRLYERYK